MTSKLLDTSPPRMNHAYLNSVRPIRRVEERSVYTIVRWSWIVLISVSLLQCILFRSLANFVAVGCVLLAWIITTSFFLRPTTLKNYPLSSFLIIGFATTQFYLPLLFTLIDGNPIVYKLELPFDVFLHSTLSMLVLTLAHVVYQLIAKNSLSVSKSALSKGGFFEPPSDMQLWIMGVVGVAATAYVWLYSPSIGWSVTGSASDKIVQAIIPFTYAPYFIPFGRLYGKSKAQSKGVVVMLVIFTLLIFLVSIGRNSRSGFMIGFASVGFAYSLGVLHDYFKPRLFTIRNVCIGVIGLWLITGPVADISTAMVLVRGQRLDIPYTELIQLTLKAYDDKEAIQRERVADVTQKEDWDETYMDNIFIQRFSNLKYIDLSLIMAAKTGDRNPDMYNFTIDHLLSIFPLPVLTFFDLDVDKNAVNSVSYGDYFYYKVSGNPYALGGYRTGHFSGTGMAAFGWWYLVLLGVGMLPVFLILNKLCIKEVAVTTSSAFNQQSNVRFSFCGLLALTSIFQFLPAESVEATTSFLLRGWIQSFLLYFVIYHVTRLLSSLIYKDVQSVPLRKFGLRV